MNKRYHTHEPKMQCNNTKNIKKMKTVQNFNLHDYVKHNVHHKTT